jgi:cytochrome c biogenesis factor
VKLKLILADQGAVAVDIEGLTTSDKPERLLLDVSKHPFINLVWLGTTLIVLGGLFVVYRRFTNLNR